MKYIRIFSNGFKEYYCNGLLHREDGPACVSKNGLQKEYFIKGKRHREDGGPTEEYYFDNDYDHSAEAVPVNYTCYKAYHFHNNLHRVDGPAVQYPDGEEKYYLFGKQYSYEDWLKFRKLITFL